MRGLSWAYERMTKSSEVRARCRSDGISLWRNSGGFASILNAINTELNPAKKHPTSTQKTMMTTPATRAKGVLSPALFPSSSCT